MCGALKKMQVHDFLTTIEEIIDWLSRFLSRQAAKKPGSSHERRSPGYQMSGRQTFAVPVLISEVHVLGNYIEPGNTQQ